MTGQSSNLEQMGYQRTEFGYTVTDQGQFREANAHDKKAKTLISLEIDAVRSNFRNVEALVAGALKQGVTEQEILGTIGVGTGFSRFHGLRRSYRLHQSNSQTK